MKNWNKNRHILVFEKVLIKTDLYTDFFLGAIYGYIPLILGFLVFDFFLVGSGVSELLDKG